MYLKLITNFNLNDIDNIIKYFPDDYIQSLKQKHTFNESIIWRYYISKLVKESYWIDNFYPKVDNNWVPILDQINWSISHKDWVCFVWVYKDKIWVDIEVVKERDISMFNYFSEKEWEIVWWKSWEHFYILWTAKESIIKYNLWKLDNITNIILISFKIKNKIIDKIVFDYELCFDFWWKKYISSVWKKDNLIYSIVN